MKIGNEIYELERDSSRRGYQVERACGDDYETFFIPGDFMAEIIKLFKYLEEKEEKFLQENRVSHNIKILGYYEGDIICPKCSTRIEVRVWSHPTCECGYEWSVQTLGFGKKPEMIV